MNSANLEQETGKNRRKSADFDLIARQFAIAKGHFSGSSGRQLLVWADDFVTADGFRRGLSPAASLGIERFGLKSLSRMATGLLFGDKP